MTLYTTKEIAHLFKVKPDTVLVWIKIGKLRSIKTAHRHFITVQERNRFERAFLNGDEKDARCKDTFEIERMKRKQLYCHGRKNNCLNTPNQYK